MAIILVLRENPASLCGVSYLYLLMFIYKEVAGELLSCLRILGQVIETKEVSAEENIRIKYVAKSIKQLGEKLQLNQEAPYIIFKGKIIGSLGDDCLIIPEGAEMLKPGMYNYAPIEENGILIAYLIEEKGN